MKKQLFPQKPENLDAVSADELRGILSAIADTGRALRAGEVDLTELGENDEERATEVIAQMTAARELKTEIKAHLEELGAAATNFVEDVSSLAADLEDEPVGPASPEAEAEAEAALAAEGEPESTEPEATEPESAESTESEGAPAAAEAELAPAAPPRRYAIPSGDRDFEPREVIEATGDFGAPILAAEKLELGGGRRVAAGDQLDRVKLALAAVAMAKRHGAVKKSKGGGEQKFLLATRHTEFSPDVTLIPGDHEGNMAKLQAIGTPFLGNEGMEALVAAGGICAPPTPFYDPPGFASRARPVRDALPTLNAPRGGVSIPAVNLIDRADTGVTVIEEDEDAQGGTFAVKACRRVECVEWTDTFVGIISHCLEVGNLNAITWPEGVALENDNLMAGWAATADTRLLNRLKALSINVETGTQAYNAIAEMVYALLRAKASIRSVLRADDASLRYTAVIPEYVKELIASDFIAQQVDTNRFVTPAAVEGYLADYGVDIYWYKDTPTTGTSQIFSAEVDSAAADSLDKFPAELQYGLWINGEFARLDTGDLELGVVRDSDLNSSNDYQLFGESFENVVRIGPAQGARWITQPLCPTGTFPALQTARSC
jgi:hypothetical protein